MLDLVKLVYHSVGARAAHRVLVGRMRARGAPERGRFTRTDVDRLLAVAWSHYDDARAGLPQQPTAGSTMNVRLACFTFSFFEALTAEGTERAYAIEMIADATWAVYELWSRVASARNRFSRGNASALGFAVTEPTNGHSTGSLRFPFNAPGYVIEPVRAKRGTAFDVVHCPVATYFKAHDAADLCLATWCNLDYALGESTGAKLVRTTTLVQGADRCDFRILPQGG